MWIKKQFERLRHPSSIAKNIRYTMQHRKAFRAVEREMFGKVSIRGWLHDIDKFLMYFFLDKEATSEIHRKFARHHVRRAKTKRDFQEMVVDWECARYTKPDKPLNAYETLQKIYPQLESEILPILQELKLNKYREEIK